MFEQIKNNVDKAIKSLKQGKPIVVLYDYNKESEGYMIYPGQTITEENIVFMLNNTNRILYLAIDSKQAKKLNLKLMVATDQNNSALKTPLIMATETKECINTDISAADRAHIIQVASRVDIQESYLFQPGHVFPLIANDKGVLGRNGHTEASVDIVRLSGFNSAGVFCELINKDGSTMKVKQIYHFAREYGLLILTINEIYQYRLSTEIFIKKIVSSTIPFTNIGKLEVTVYKDIFDSKEVIVLSKPYKGNIPLVRIHSSCLTGDIFGSLRCDCQSQLQKGIKMISKQGGYFIYLDQEGRGIGLTNKLKAYNLQMHQNMDTIEANKALGLPVDARKYDLAIQVLKYNRVKICNLISNNPKKLEALSNVSIQAHPIYHEAFINSHNRNYLVTKKNKTNHIIRGL